MDSKVDKLWEALVQVREGMAVEREACDQTRRKMVQHYVSEFSVALEITRCEDLIRIADATELPALQAQLKELQAIARALREAPHHRFH